MQGGENLSVQFSGSNAETETVGYGRHDAFQVAREVRYYAHVVPSLEVDPPKLRNGGRVRPWGRLPQPDAARRGVILQANVVGSKRWITLAPPHHRRGGRVRIEL